VRRWTDRLGQQEAEEQQQEAVALLAPTAEQARAERDAEARRQRLGVPSAAELSSLAVPVVPARLVVGLDGG